MKAHSLTHSLSYLNTYWDKDTLIDIDMGLGRDTILSIVTILC